LYSNSFGESYTAEGNMYIEFRAEDVISIESNYAHDGTDTTFKCKDYFDLKKQEWVITEWEAKERESVSSEEWRLIENKPEFCWESIISSTELLQFISRVELNKIYDSSKKCDENFNCEIIF